MIDEKDRKKAECGLESAGNNYELLVSTIKDYAIFMIDRHGCVSSWNSGAENIKGYTAAEVLGQPIDIFYTTEEIQQGEPKRNLALAREYGHFETTGWRVRKDKSEFYANVVFTALIDERGAFCGYAKVTKDISAQRKAEAALEALNAEMEAFTYSVSHDLRTPLRAITGFTAILEEDYGSRLDDEAKRITAIIRRNTLKMGCLIDDLLAFCKLGRQDPVKSTIDTNSMVAEVIGSLTQGNETVNVRWEIQDLPLVAADLSTLRQVWVNLLSNAIKYTGRQPWPYVQIGSFMEKGQISFYVRDNGVGFNNKYRDKLFKVFQRLHSDDQFEGTGIGLALVAKIITKHGGCVWAKGVEDEGACFYFSLPTA